MKILLIVDDYLPSTKSAPLMMQHLSVALQSKNHEVTLLTPSADIKKPYEISTDNPCRVIRFSAGRLKNINFFFRALHEMMLSWNMIILYFRLKQQLQTDLIVFYVPSIFFGIGVFFLKNIFKCHSIMILRDIFPQWAIDNKMLHPYSPITLFFRLFEKINYASADKIFVQSAGNLEYFKKSFFRKKISVLYNWFAPDFKCVHGTGLREQNELEGKVVFFYGGNMGYAQNMLNLVKLVRNMKRISNAFFLFVGQGDEFELVKENKKKYQLDNLLLLPAVSQQKYFQLLDQCDIGLFSLHPSLLTQNFPGKLLGYMAYSKPILGSVNPGNDVQDVINQSGAGFISINPDDNSFLHHAQMLASDSVLRKQCGLASRQLLEEKFNVYTAIEKILL